MRDRPDPVRITGQEAPGLRARLNDGVIGVPHAVAGLFATRVIPDIFHWVEFRGIRGQPRWCMDRALVTSAVSGRISADPGRDRHAERRHPVENAAPDFGFCPLVRQSPGVESPADDGLVAKHGGLDQAPSIVT
jgi:hypothetical protein